MNLLDISKAEEGQLVSKRGDVTLRQLVEQVASELRIYAQEREVSLRISLATDSAYADDDLLRRTLTNLVENAIRYAPAKTSVSITWARTAEGTELRVADAGRGIPADMREKVFNAFVRIEPGEGMGEPASRGLGLTFCKLVVEAHGGRIWIEGGNPGTIFCVRLPHAPSIDLRGADE
jgi:signal transduction histidine kinase